MTSLQRAKATLMRSESLSPESTKSPSEGTVSFKKVSYHYPNGVQAVSNLDLDFEVNSRVAIVGPSGCGKTTLLHLLTGLRTPTGGELRRPAWSSHQHPMSMVFQSDTLLPWLTASENVAQHFLYKRASRKYVAARAHELLTMVGLQDFADAYPYELSGGMRRRIAFLAAVAPKPGALLLDEPFSSLDEPTRVALHADALKIMAEVEMTVVLVTHDLAEAITLSDEVVLMSARPCSVAERHTVHTRRDLDPIALRQDPDFLSLYGRLWEGLSRQIPSRHDEEGMS